MPTTTKDLLQRGLQKRKFLYRQVADLLTALIESGEYRPGERLPSLDCLAVRFGLNRLTVSKALRELAARQLVETIPARGTFVVERAPVRRAELTGMTIGMVSRVMVPGMTGHYHLMLSEAIRGQLASHGANMLILPAANIEPEAEIVDLIRRSRLDAAIYVGPFSEELLPRLANETGVPGVLLDQSLIGLELDAIRQDNEAGGFLIADHLLRLGHRRLAVVTGPASHESANDRLRGVIHACRRHGVADPQTVIEADYTANGGRVATVTILKARKLPTAIIYLNDEMAVAGLELLQKRRGDFAVTGYDDVPLAARHGLTTVQAPVADLGAIAVDLLRRRLEFPDQARQQIKLQPSLVVRESTPTP